jgi:4,5:9,10-diseco-3-hydroxy-5,9,17-trioxoandrosta-1(10),2-diene-4-oate hydrolase
MPAKPVPESRYVTLQSGYKMHLIDQGQGPAVVFLHGSGSGACGHSNFKHNYPQLRDAGYRVILLDLIGYGYSDKPADIEYPLDLFVSTVRETLQLCGVERCTLIGNSLGGAIAIGLALAHPQAVEKLVLMAPGGVEDQPDYFKMPGMALMKEVFMSAEPVTAARLKDFFVRGMVADSGSVDDQTVNERYELMQLQNPQVVRTMKVPNMSERLHEIECPALGFWGAEEKMMPETGILKLVHGMRNLRMIVVPRCGHWVMVEHRDLFNRMTLDFLRNG